tara:strand:- start:21 stop:383 length:363 start_codon:yes stop_codon:yes gene_type:complete
MYILRLPQRVTETVENANRSISELRFSVTSLLLPVKLLLWFCIVIVFLDLFFNKSVNQSFAYRTICGIMDQLWYVIFYFSIPCLWQNVKKKANVFINYNDWVLVNEMEELDGDWVIVTNG